MDFCPHLVLLSAYLLPLGQIGAVTGQHSFLHEQSQIISEKTEAYVNHLEYF